MQPTVFNVISIILQWISLLMLFTSFVYISYDFFYMHHYINSFYLIEILLLMVFDVFYEYTHGLLFVALSILFSLAVFFFFLQDMMLFSIDIYNLFITIYSFFLIIKYFIILSFYPEDNDDFNYISMREV